MRRDFPAQQIDCHACPAREGCFRPVVGRGRQDAEILLLGEAPDNASHSTAVAFDEAGHDGRKLSWLYQHVGIDPAEVRVFYSVGCHVPPHADGRYRAPEREWVLACRHWVGQEIAACQEAYEARYPGAGYQQVLILVGSRPLLSVLGPGRWAPEDYTGHWLSSDFYPALKNGIFALPSFLTLRDDIRTPIIEEQWREALDKLWRALGLMEKLVDPPPPEITLEDLPACRGPYKDTTPCKCDLLMRRLWQIHRGKQDIQSYHGAQMKPRSRSL